MVHFGVMKASALAGSFTSVAGTQGEQNSPPCGGGLSTILSPEVHLVTLYFGCVSNLEWSGVWNWGTLQRSASAQYRELLLCGVMSPQSVFSQSVGHCRVGLCRVVPPQRVATGYSAELWHL